MRFEWDPSKNRINQRKHGISFELAIEIFSDPRNLAIHDRFAGDEQRLWTLGRIANLTVVVVVHTYRERDGDEIVRVISARKATRRERRIYEEADE